MLPNEITLAVDEENDGVGPVNHVYSRYDEYQNRSVYISADHSTEARDTLTFYRTPPKVNGNFRGVSKVAMKFSCETSVTGVDGVSNVIAPVIIELSCSLPVGVTAAEKLIARQRAIALLDRDDVMDPLFDALMI